MENRKIKMEVRKGQIALESLLIVGFLFVFLIPLLVYVSSILASESWKIDAEQGNVAVRRLADVASKLALSGPGSSSLETVFLPSSTSKMSVNGTVLIVTIDTRNFGPINQAAVADSRLVLNAASDWENVRGTNIIQVENIGGQIWLTKS